MKWLRPISIGLALLLQRVNVGMIRWFQTSWVCGGWAQTSAINGTNVYADTDGRVILSADNSASRNAVNAGPRDSRLHALVVNGKSIFVGTDSDVFRSTNDSASREEDRAKYDELPLDASTPYNSICFCGVTVGSYFGLKKMLFAR